MSIEPMQSGASWRSLLFAATLALSASPSWAQLEEVLFEDSFEALVALSPEDEAARFLTQATFGPKRELIAPLVSQGYDAWITQQIALTPSLHRPLTVSYPPPIFQNQRQQAWWDHAVNAPDQLRQRVAFALSEILVTSDRSDALVNLPEMLADYYDILVRNALGNYRQLLQEVSLSPAMGLYLSHLGNDKPDAATGRRPDENYAREIMQLFTIGLWQLNQDGTPVLNQGQQIPTYSQSDIEGLARVFTGFTFANSNSFEFPNFGELGPMEAFEDHHDTDAKTIVTGAQLPAGQTALADLNDALDVLFNHPNVGPFLSRRLIQRLVTSNPTPGYIQRVAQVFNNNGSGVRGDLAATVRAILLDPEAREGYLQEPDSFGKLREPILRVSALWRAFDAAPDNGVYGFWNAENSFAQAALRSPSVFNFFLPDYQPPGELLARNLVAPEFQIQTESSGINMINGFDGLDSIVGRWYVNSGFGDAGTIRNNFERELPLLSDSAALVDHLNHLLMYGTMSDEMAAVLVNYVDNSGNLAPRQRIANTVFLVVTSAEYAVQR